MSEEYKIPTEYHAYCSHQTPDISPVDQFECCITDSFCDRTRENAHNCSHIRDTNKQKDITDNFDECPDQPGGRPGGSATLHF